MCRSDLLLLDEPTNHPNLDARGSDGWRDWPNRHPGLDAADHPRPRFSRRRRGRIVHGTTRNSTTTPATTSASSACAPSIALSAQQSAFVKQQRQIAHLKSYVDRFRAKATKAKQAQSRIKTLERMEVIAAAHVDSPFEFSFREPANKPRQLCTLKEASLGYGGTRHLGPRRMALVLRRPHRVAGSPMARANPRW